MDLYISSLLLGVTGLGAMALSGLGSHGHSGGAHGHGHGGADAHVGHVGHGHLGAHAHGVAHHTAGGHHAISQGGQGGASRALWAMASPRFLFSFCLGFGAAGTLLHGVLAGPLLAVAAIAGAVLFERLLVSPLWNFTMRFASAPAQMLESAVTDEATAVTSFDANGQGIVSIEVDGQIQQILATLKDSDRLLGSRVRAGQRLRIDEVDAEQNRCTVSVL
jgi:hypothetical protein